MGLALDLEDYHPSVLLHCWLSHLTCKIVSKMTYNVLSGTLNPTIPYQTPCWFVVGGVASSFYILIRWHCDSVKLHSVLRWGNVFVQVSLRRANDCGCCEICHWGSAECTTSSLCKLLTHHELVPPLFRSTLWQSRPDKAGSQMSVRPFAKSFLDFNEIWRVGRGGWVMHNGMQCDPIQGQGQGHELFKVGNPTIFKCYLLRYLQWELASDHEFLNYGTMSKFWSSRIFKNLA